MPKMRRLLDIGTDSPGKVEITTKCPKCRYAHHRGGERPADGGHLLLPFQ